MKFAKLAEYLNKLENTTKRLEITDILTDLIKDLSPNEIEAGINLSLGFLKAPFESEKFNIAEKMMIKILEQTYATTSTPNLKDKIVKLFQETGDLGTTAFQLSKSDKKSDLEIMGVQEILVDIAQVEGSGSQDLKIKKTTNLLKQLSKQSVKYAVRIILGTTRLGFTSLTVIDALSNFIKGDKSLRKEIEAVYSVYPDIGLIAKKIKTKGIEGIKDINLETGVPVLSQKAQRLKNPQEAIEKMEQVWAEFKFDGTRVQLHLDKNKKSKSLDQTDLFGSKDRGYMIKTFTRNLEETTHQYPDIAQAADKQVDAKSVILDGEAIGYDKKTGEFLPFQETMQRKRKHGIGETAKSIPLKYFVFDILYLNGKPLVELSLKERRKHLNKIIKKGETIVIDEHLETNEVKKLNKYFNDAKEKGLEGLVVKKPGDAYQAGARSFSWVKLKAADQSLLEDSVDCVVLGYYAGRGVRSKFGIGGFLVGVRDEKMDTFKTISKIGTGLTDQDWVNIKEKCDKVRVDKKPASVDMDKIFLPDVFVSPKIVVEIGADEISESPSHTAGYALRFPRLLKFRDDKNPSEATTVKEIKDMHKAQKRGLY